MSVSGAGGFEVKTIAAEVVALGSEFKHIL